MIADGAFYYLDAPVKRMGAMDVPIPFSPVLGRPDRAYRRVGGRDGEDAVRRGCEPKADLAYPRNGRPTLATNVIMPALGMAQDTGKIIRWLKTRVSR